MAQDYYSILGVPRDASAQDIKKAFRLIARECHPDVAGGDPKASERFKVARKAYETLMDPVTRARYDRRGQRRAYPRGSFFDAFYKSTEPEQRQARPTTYGAHDAGGHRSGGKGRKDPGNNLDLDDLFKDFGDFGFGGSGRPESHRRSSTEPPPPTPNTPSPGADVHIELDVPGRVAKDGGSVTAVYYRMQRADSWRPGAADPGIVRVQDIADVRVIPGTRDGEVLRERALGDAGPHGGPYGDLVVRIRVVADAASRHRPPPPDPVPPRRTPRAQHKPEERPADPTNEPAGEQAPGPSAEASGPQREPPKLDADGSMPLDVSVTEAILGGRFHVETPQGGVKLTVRPGTSSGTRMRLKKKGPLGEDGEPTDLFVVTRIVVPQDLDDESRQLIERFAELNPASPRDE